MEESSDKNHHRQRRIVTAKEFGSPVITAVCICGTSSARKEYGLRVVQQHRPQKPEWPKP